MLAGHLNLIWVFTGSGASIAFHLRAGLKSARKRQIAEQRLGCAERRCFLRSARSPFSESVLISDIIGRMSFAVDPPYCQVRVNVFGVKTAPSGLAASGRESVGGF